jgi:hypothetical protein
MATAVTCRSTGMDTEVGAASAESVIDKQILTIEKFPRSIAKGKQPDAGTPLTRLAQGLLM